MVSPPQAKHWLSDTSLKQGIASIEATGSFCGIDWGGYSHQICVLVTRAVEVRHHKITHTVDGLAALVALRTSIAGPVRIAIERVEGLLVECLQQWCDAETYCVSTKYRTVHENDIGWRQPSPTSSMRTFWRTPRFTPKSGQWLRGHGGRCQ